MSRRRPLTYSHEQEVEVPVDGWFTPDDQALAYFRVVTTVETDPHYGADADGNRGMSVTEWSSEATLLRLEGPDGEALDVATVPADRLALLTKAAEEAAEAELASNDPWDREPDDEPADYNDYWSD